MAYARVRATFCDHVEMSFRIFAVAWLAGGCLGAQTAAPFEVEEATIAQVHQAMRDRRLTCRGLVDAYIRRINTYDKNGPAINAIVTINPDATKEAEELDRRFAQSGLTGPLHCVPMIVKDNFETKGLQTSNGALAFAGYQPKEDATQVARVKAAGAIVLAKSNMAEWAFSPVETVSSILPGYTKNPYALDRVTAGSSGGTAAAIAASFGLVGFGSDTGDSIRGPSSHLSLAGIRSTMGLTSRAGVFPLNLRADIAGPIARTMEDAVKVFQVIVGEDPRDPATAAAKGRAIPDYSKSLDRNGLKGAVIGVLHEAYERDSTDPEIVQIFMRALEDLRRAGATVVDPAKVEGLEVKRQTGPNPCMGFKYDLNHFLADRSWTGSRGGSRGDSEVREIPSLDAEAAGGCGKGAGEWPGFGSVPSRRRLSRTIPGNGGEDDGPAEAGCLRVSHVEQSTAADWGFEYAGRR